MLKVIANESAKCKLRSFEKEEDGDDLTYYIGWDVVEKESRITGLHITVHTIDGELSSGNVGVTYEEMGDEDLAEDEAQFLYEDGSGIGEDGIDMVAELLDIEGYKMSSDYCGSEQGMQDIGYCNYDVDFEQK